MVVVVVHWWQLLEQFFAEPGLDHAIRCCLLLLYLLLYRDVGREGAIINQCCNSCLGIFSRSNSEINAVPCCATCGLDALLVMMLSSVVRVGANAVKDVIGGKPRKGYGRRIVRGRLRLLVKCKPGWGYRRRIY